MEEKNYEKKQYQMAKISAVANVLMLAVVIVCAVVLVPQLLNTMKNVDTVMVELETVTSHLAESLPEMLEDVDTLVTSSEEGVAEAMEKISAIDIKSLNEAIRDLQTVVEPLARFLR